MTQETKAKTLSVFSAIKRPENLEGLNSPRHQNLGNYTGGIFRDFSQATQDYLNGLAAEPRLVVIFDGPPGDGKTFLIDRFNEALEAWTGEKSKEDLMRNASGSTRWMSRNPWEITGLRAAREEGAITTGRFELANLDGLKRANELHEAALARSVRESFIVTSEQVDVAALLVDPETDDFYKRYRGRAMGNDAALNLFRGRGSFQGMSERFNILPRLIGVAGGKRLEVKADERWEMQEATGLGDARKKAKKFGSDGPADIDELHRMQTQGASKEQMKGINDVVRDQITYLKQTSRINDPTDPYRSFSGERPIWLPNKPRFDAEFYDEVTSVVGMSAGDRRFSGYLRTAVTALFQEIYENDFGLTRGSNNYGIFVNNPSWEQLNIGPKEQRALKRFYRKEEMLTGRR